jgi:hypothetical protein
MARIAGSALASGLGNAVATVGVRSDAVAGVVALVVIDVALDIDASDIMYAHKLAKKKTKTTKTTQQKQ